MVKFLIPIIFLVGCSGPRDTDSLEYYRIMCIDDLQYLKSKYDGGISARMNRDGTVRECLNNLS